jgi:hypothetical protein
MSKPTGSTAPAFQAMERRQAELQARYSRGDISASQYQAAIQRLTFRDESGQTWWLGGEVSTWRSLDCSTNPIL